MSLIILFMTLLSLTIFGEDNLIGQSGLNEIKVEYITVNDVQKMKFVHCSRDYVDEEYRCQDLSANSYTQLELNKLMSSEKIEAHLKTAGVVVGAIVAGVILYYGGSTVAAAASGSGSAILTLFKTKWGLQILGAISGIGVASSPLWLKKMNPFRQYKQANIFKNRNFIDNDLTVSEEDVLKAADLLSDIL